MEEKPQTEPIAKAPHITKMNTLWPILSLLVGALIAGGGAYYWQQSKVTNLDATVSTLSNDITKLRQQLSQSEQANNNSSKDNSTTPTPSSDEQVIAAVKNYCNANVDPTTKQPLVLKVGTAGPSQKSVLYSADKYFAYVNAVCNKDGVTEGNSSAYYLKKVNNTWLFLYRGQESSPQYTAQFDIPSDFN